MSGEHEMKRRDFALTGAAGVLGAGLTGCSASKPKKVQLWRELSHFSPKPLGTMPMSELGNTGVKVSKLTFGSHIRREMIGYDSQREHVIREAFDLGITTFDVYDSEGRCYQYEPMGKMLKPINKDVVISLSIRPDEGRTVEQEFERALKLFNRDHIDMVRSNIADKPKWQHHEYLARCKEKGMIRAIGAAIHDIPQLAEDIDTYPLDYVLFPHNFYHNVFNPRDQHEDMEPLLPMLRSRGIGVVTMKPFGGDWLVTPFIQVARELTDNPDVRFPQAALRYVLNSTANPDTVFCGMYSTNHVYDDILAFYEPEMSAEEHKLLDDIRDVAVQQASAWLPDHYKWLDNWAQRPDVKQT